MLPHSTGRATRLALALIPLAVVVALLWGLPTSRADEPAVGGPHASPYFELFLPLIGRSVGYPFPTDPPPLPTATPTATATRRPTLTPTASLTPEATLTATATPSPSLTPAASATLPPGITPSATATVTRTPEPTETPWWTDPTPTPTGRVAVVSSKATLGERGSQPIVSVVGEVRNEAATSVEAVSVVVALIDDRLVTVKTVNAEVFGDVLGPGQSAPFRVVTERPADCPVEYCTGQATVNAWVWSAAAPLPTLAPPQNTYQASGSQAALLGRVVNTTDMDMTRLRVVAVFRDINDAVADVFASGLGDSPYGLVVAPGGWTPYRVELPAGYTGTGPQFALVYSPATTPAPLPLPTRAINEQRAASHLDIWGQVENSSGQAIREAQVIASFYDAAERVVHVDWTWVSQNADRILNPGVVAPFQVTLDGPDANAWRRYELQTFYRRAPQPLPSGASLQSPTYLVDAGQVFVTLRGRVSNGTEAALDEPRLVATFLKGGKVQYALSERIEAAAGLAPGASVDYVITHSLPSGVALTLQGATVEWGLDFLP